jgi:hypothetical protein
MPYANPEDKKRSAKAWYARNRARLLLQAADRYESKGEEIRAVRQKFRNENPEIIRQEKARHYQKHRASILKRAKKYREKNSEKIRTWRKTNRDYLRRHQLNRRKTDSAFRLLDNLRGRLRAALKGRCKSASTQQLIGCSISELHAHIEKQFRPGMTWENYGPVWHIDHARPCKAFNLSSPIEQRKCFNFRNLQPLFAKENLQKNASICPST